MVYPKDAVLSFPFLSRIVIARIYSLVASDHTTRKQPSLCGDMYEWALLHRVHSGYLFQIVRM